jgi:hypothetical protein
MGLRLNLPVVPKLSAAMATQVPGLYPDHNQCIRSWDSAMSWTELLRNAKPIEFVYSVTPPLKGVRMYEIRLHQDGPCISLRFDLSQFPDPPPQKWSEGHFNTAQLTLVLIDVRDVQIDGWGLDNIGDIDLKEANAGVQFSFTSSSSRVLCHAQFVDIEKLSGYSTL